jgi:hypothetical protein
MRKAAKKTTTQFPLFPAPARNQQLPCEVNPKLLPLVVSLLRKYAGRNVIAPRVPEVNHE